MTQSAHSLVTSWIDVWNNRELEGLAALAGANYVHHTMSGQDLDLEGFTTGLDAILTAFDDLEYVIDHLVADGEHAAVYLVATGTQSGPFIGIAPTGQAVAFRGAYHCRVEDGRIAEDWDVFDLFTPLLRLGGSISPPAASSLG